MAKFIAIADWRIANLVHGDYYCERVAEMVREATAKIVALSGEISGHSEKAVEAVMEALALTGIAMQYVKLSVPQAEPSISFLTTGNAKSSNAAYIRTSTARKWAWQRLSSPTFITK